MNDPKTLLDGIRFNADGLVPAIAQDRNTGRVLMLAWANKEAVERTLATGDAHFWSRSRKELWRKGDTSGHVLRNAALHLDCDGDTLLMMVDPSGPACHTGMESCFDGVESSADEAAPAGASSFGSVEQLWATLESRASERPEGSYTARLLDDPNLRYKKLGEETTELVVALTTGDSTGVAEEAADLIYHVLAALLGAGVPWSDVQDVLDGRRR